ncbi:lipopolysaccharide heptosyltransferase I [Crenothrix polyspora]|uniref:Lipopolysaccharide heptosyltransferase 1 n=1 Tax=Crenothrix polyspora TaxID=360316 RepID=A0A1R4H9Z4_9GAMM|nr:lipopolysaccharide heptosyltransferase I [Crenothrix polyspora]SJM93082.1 Lipopolysaccharide heptosyltransferase I [Crenothrix polyspora]
MKIAIIKLSALGDIIHAMVALQFIKAQRSDIEIDWIVEERFADILKHNPDINQLLTINIKSLKTNKINFFRQVKKVRGYARNRYDLVIDAQGLLKSAVTARLLGKPIAGYDIHSIREKAASWFYDVKIACAYDENTIDRKALVLSSPLGIGISKEQIVNKAPFLFFSDEDPQIYDYLLKEHINIIMVIGSTWDSRNYPAAKFIAIAESLQENCLVVWGSEEEKIKADWMATQSDYIQVMPKLDLNSLKALIAQADLLIGNDTGPTHMAWALNKPSITLFGPTPISRVYQTDINKVIKSSSIVNPFKLNKQDYSIKDINEQEVITLAKLLLTASKK